jgi:hypothetical protein
MKPNRAILDDLAALLDTPASPWVDRLVSARTADLDLHELCELAAEVQPGGTLATVRGLLEGLMVRHAHDDVTVAALSAVLDLHLPNLLDV